MSSRAEEIGANLKELEESVSAVCVRLDRPIPCIVAVSKTKPVEDVLAAYHAGHRHFGENYVIEFIEKAPQLSSDIVWHFIGHIQSNKVAKLLAIPNLAIIESVHSASLAQRLSKFCAKAERTVTIYLQVNTSGEPSKSGVAPEEAVQTYLDIVSDKDGLYSNITLSGLMTIGMYGGDGTAEFVILASLREKILARMEEENLGEEQRVIALSMGMSADYEAAIVQGSTNVRVGSTIFGARNYNKK